MLVVTRSRYWSVWRVRHDRSSRCHGRRSDFFAGAQSTASSGARSPPACATLRCLSFSEHYEVHPTFVKGADCRAVERLTDEVAFPVSRYEPQHDLFGASVDLRFLWDKARTGCVRSAYTACALLLAPRLDPLLLQRPVRLSADIHIDHFKAEVLGRIARSLRAQSGRSLLRRPATVLRKYCTRINTMRFHQPASTTACNVRAALDRLYPPWSHRSQPLA